MKCTKCGSELRGNAVFCDACGTKVESQIIRCKMCGYALRDISKFCDKCGTKTDLNKDFFGGAPLEESFDLDVVLPQDDISLQNESISAEQSSNNQISQSQLSGNYAANSGANSNNSWVAKSAKPKSKKWIWITSLILLVVLSASAGALYYMHLNGKSTPTVKEPVKEPIKESVKEDSNAIVAISADGYRTVGLKKDGTVVAIGYNDDGQCNVSGWKDIVAISAGYYHTVGLKKDGTVVAVGLNDYGQCDVDVWNK